MSAAQLGSWLSSLISKVSWRLSKMVLLFRHKMFLNNILFGVVTWLEGVGHCGYDLQTYILASGSSFQSLCFLATTQWTTFLHHKFHTWFLPIISTLEIANHGLNSLKLWSKRTLFSFIFQVSIVLLRKQNWIVQNRVFLWLYLITWFRSLCNRPQKEFAGSG